MCVNKQSWEKVTCKLSRFESIQILSNDLVSSNLTCFLQIFSKFC